MEKNQGQNATGPLDIEDLKEQGIRSDSVGSKTPGAQQNKSNSKFEFATDISQGVDLKKTFTSLRDLDVDAMGKSKSGFDFNFFRKK